jgi:hypothetical protein
LCRWSGVRPTLGRCAGASESEGESMPIPLGDTHPRVGPHIPTTVGKVPYLLTKVAHRGAPTVDPLISNPRTWRCNCWKDATVILSSGAREP